MPMPILGSEGPQGVITRYRPASRASTAQVETWDMTGIFEVDDAITWSLMIDGTEYTATVTMDTDLETTGAALADSINGTVPADSVVATFDTETLTITAAEAGIAFSQEYSLSSGRTPPVYPTTATFDTVTSYGEQLSGISEATTGRASKQPAEGEQLMALPEGERSKDVQIFLTYLELRAADQYANTPPDEVVDADGWRYVIWKSARVRAVIPHYEAIGVRKPEGLDG